MRIFLTGSTGFIGSQVALNLIESGHRVLGMTRSGSGARVLAEMGVQAHLGDIEDLQSLQRGAAECDAAIHTAFDHDFSNFVENCQKDRRAIIALGSAFEGTNRPLVISSSTAMGERAPGEKAIEDFFNPEHRNPRVASELAGLELSQRGVNVSVMRLAQIHDTKKQGLVSELVKLARKTGISAFIQGTFNSWSATHVKDAAQLFCLALEKGAPGSRYHASAEEAVSFQSIAQTIAQTLELPVVAVRAEDALAHFGWLTPFVSKDMSASSVKTKELLHWSPNGPTLLADLKKLAHA